MDYADLTLPPIGVPLSLVQVARDHGGALGVVENSWTKPRGMDDTIEVFGTEGQTYADMLMGNAPPTYSEVGYGSAVEKAASTKGAALGGRPATRSLA